MRISFGSAEQPLHGEDRSLASLELGLFGVFDGVGGVPGSARAAEFAAGSIAGFCRRAGPPSLQVLAEACEFANGEISRRQLGCTTATLAWVAGGALLWVSIGDSRLYLWHRGALAQVSSDQGEGNVVYNVLGMPWAEASLTVQRGALELEPGDRLALVTDGVTGDFAPDLLGLQELRPSLELEDPQLAAEALVRSGRKRDDRTALVVACT